MQLGAAMELGFGRRPGGVRDGERGARVQCARVARHVVNHGAHVVGLVPAGVGRPLGPLLDGIADLLHEITSGVVGIVLSHERWTGFADAGAIRGEGDVLTRPLRAGVELVAFPPQPHAFAAAAELERAMPFIAARYDRVLVDLTGLEKLTGVGALVRAVATFAMVAGPGRSRRPELLRVAHALPAARTIGVILYG